MSIRIRIWRTGGSQHAGAFAWSARAGALVRLGGVLLLRPSNDSNEASPPCRGRALSRPGHWLPSHRARRATPSRRRSSNWSRSPASPSAATVITADDIRDYGYRTLAEALCSKRRLRPGRVYGAGYLAHQCRAALRLLQRLRQHRKSAPRVDPLIYQPGSDPWLPLRHSCDRLQNRVDFLSLVSIPAPEERLIARRSAWKRADNKHGELLDYSIHYRGAGGNVDPTNRIPSRSFKSTVSAGPPLL
jgi:hypothetical protein